MANKSCRKAYDDAGMHWHTLCKILSLCIYGHINYAPKQRGKKVKCPAKAIRGESHQISSDRKRHALDKTGNLKTHLTCEWKIYDSMCRKSKALSVIAFVCTRLITSNLQNLSSLRLHVLGHNRQISSQNLRHKEYLESNSSSILVVC